MSKKNTEVDPDIISELREQVEQYEELLKNLSELSPPVHGGKRHQGRPGVSDRGQWRPYSRPA